VNLNAGDIIVLDASIFVTRLGGRRAVDKILNSSAKLAISDTLMNEYARNWGVSGADLFISFHQRLRPLEEAGKIVYKKDEEIEEIVPKSNKDSHLVNLCKTTSARALVTKEKRLKCFENNYGLNIIDLNEFLDD